MASASKRTLLPAIPPRPEILLELSKLQDPGVADVATLVKKDVCLAASVLKIANTPLFSRGRQISSIDEASSRLGVTRLFAVIRAAALSESIPEPTGFERFWDTAQDTAQICLRLG